MINYELIRILKGTLFVLKRSPFIILLNKKKFANFPFFPLADFQQIKEIEIFWNWNRYKPGKLDVANPLLSEQWVNELVHVTQLEITISSLNTNFPEQLK